VSKSRIKRIGILTGGGDCPGLNAVIRGVTKPALDHGLAVLGIQDGFEGLVEGKAIDLYNKMFQAFYLKEGQYLAPQIAEILFIGPKKIMIDIRS